MLMWVLGDVATGGECGIDMHHAAALHTARPAIDDDHRALIREQPVLQPRAGFQRPHRHDRIMPRHTAAKAC
jgi:hypothetical protein